MTARTAVPSRRVRVGSALVGPLARTRADLGTVLVGTVVLAIAAFLAVLLPGVIEGTADGAVHAAVRDAGSGADTTIVARFPSDGLAPRQLEPDSAAQTIGQAVRFAGALPPELAAVVRPPVASVVTSPYPLTLPAGSTVAPTDLRLAWLWSGAEPAVRWVAGGPPAGTATVEVGLSQDVATALSVRAGDTLTWNTHLGRVDLLVAGVFVPVDVDDPAWAAAPGVLGPRTSGQGSARHTDAVALLSADSLPVARLAVDPGATTRTFTFRAAPGALGVEDIDRVAQAVAAIRAAPVSLGFTPTPDVRSRLGLVLLEVRERIDVARAQAAVLVVAVLTVSGLALLLIARVLADRRGQVLSTQRARGASLPALAASLAVESAAVTAVGVAVGALAAVPLVASHVDGAWLVPVAVLGLAAGPVGALPPTGLRRPSRRLAVEAAVLLLAAGGVVALRLRDVSAAAGATGPDPLLAAAPTVLVVAGALVLLRLLPLGVRALLTGATRARSAVPLLAAARAATAAGRPLLLLLLTVAVGLACAAATVDATVHAGQEDASWTAVGADATVRTEPSDALTAVAERLTAAPGVDLAVPARVEDVPLAGVPGYSEATLLVVDPAAYARLLARTPLPDLPQLRRLDGAAGPLPALLGPDLAAAAGATPAVLWNRQPVAITVAGTGFAAGTVVVPRDALPEADADLAAPNTLWVVGAGAARAVTAAPDLVGAQTTDREAWQAARRADPLTRGLTLLARVTALVLLGLAVLGVLLGAAAGARERRTTLAALRTLGVTSAQVRRITAGELLPPVLAATLGGAALGVLSAALAARPLALRLLTGQPADPVLSLPWPVLLVVLVLLPATVGVVVALEALARRQERVGTVLRIGGA
ncbi:FtsX-like permease family protein [Petropleomorpha daqingensis]|uniref:Putative ABC transport system permease protein n=1 Tax=Petropleomorpha daqingensis TaxID=2026353 RepID=A0A853CKC3_9ACTN|nr:FtsX-like permease family protein [Petropleomorpha daqingensis]NYJ06423.1 putative ABC transport system permease protein [Petropleomorpha daqingensis]